MSLEPLLTWLRTGQDAAGRLDFPVGTALPDGRLDLCKSDLGPLGAKAVVGALPHGGPVRHLLLGTDKLGDSGATAATEGALQAGASTVYLGCNGITEGGACSIAERIAASPGVVRGLWLKRNPIGPSGIQAIAGLVVKRLFLSGNELTDAPALAALVGECGIEELYLSACRLGDRGAALIAAGLKPGLKRLSVASNGIGPEAATELVRAATLAGVEVLDLGRVRAAGVLGADDNRVNPSSLADVLSAEQHRLWHVDLRHTGVDSRGALRLLAGAERASSATRLVLGGGIAKRVKRDLRDHAAGLPELRPHPDVAAIVSVHR